MAHTQSDRLSAVDAAFLAVEDVNTHAHIGSVATFEAGPLTGPDGELQIDRIVELARARLHKAPRFRQRIAWVPGFGHPVWVDDPDVDLLYHMRQTALPHPGDERQLKRLAGRIMSQPLDLQKPPWELWFVEGVEGGRVAVVSKLHHCMVDGVSGRDALNMLMGPEADFRPKPAPKWKPRPVPSGARLFLDELRHRLTLPLRLAADEAGRQAQGWKTAASARESLRSLFETGASGLAARSETPLNAPIGPHRRLDWTRMSLDEVKEVRTRAGSKVNDVVLSVVAGALRSFLEQRGTHLAGLTFRAAVPVNLRSDDERGGLGNRVSSLLVELPLDEPDAWKRLLRIADMTRQAKGSGQARGIELVERLFELAPSRVSAFLWRWIMLHQSANLVITNVPGAPVPIYMLGARLLESYPVVPIVPGQALGIALFSYNGGLFWGLDADWDLVPDLHSLVEGIQLEFETLRKAASAAPRS